jgi:hypothetical protein
MTIEAFALATLASRRDAGTDLMRAAELATQVSDALHASSESLIQRMIVGAGLCRDRSLLAPTILAHRAFLPSVSEELLPAYELPGLQEALTYLLGGWTEELRATLRVLLVADGDRYSNPGTEISGTSKGRMGPHVRWNSGRQGFLTAGHVASSAGAVVTDTHGTTLGTVDWSNDPALAASTSGDVDAALVTFHSGFSAATGRASVVAPMGAALTIASTGQQADVFGFFDTVRFGSAQACYAECYVTEVNISRPGDSGALVEATGDVAGMVIGGFVHRDMTVVQAIGYQLSEIRRRSGHIVSR